MNDTTRRFLTAIVDRIPAGGRIVELRLFPAIRQSGIESGVAVVAVEPPPPEVVAAEQADGVDTSIDGVITDEGAEALASESVHAEAGSVDAAGSDPNADPRSDSSSDPSSVSSSASSAAPRSASSSDLTPTSAAASAYGDLVDTDVVAEEEEGLSDDEIAASPSFVPLADTTGDPSVEDALDDEVAEIVISASRDLVAASGPRANGAPAKVLADVADGDPAISEGASHLARHVEAHADTPASSDTVSNAADDSPYADAPAQRDGESRPILSAVAADGEENGVPLALTPTDAQRPSDGEGEAGVSGGSTPAPHTAPADVASPYLSPIAGADTLTPLDEEFITLGDILALPSPSTGDASDERSADQRSPSPAAAPVVPLHRYNILTARYRLTLKGPDRGKWDVDITHEADAPLETVERVARGVAKRSGDESQPEHFSAESLQAALEAPVWATTP